MRYKQSRSEAFLWIAAATWLCVLTLAAPTRAQTATFPLIWFLGFNTTLPPFNDVLARQAVAAAVDRTKLAQAAKMNLANGTEPPGCLGHDSNARVRAYNPQQAREMLAQAGVKPEELGELGVWVLSTFAGSAVGQEEVSILVTNLTGVGLQVAVRHFGNYDALQRIAVLPVVKMSFWGLRWDTASCSHRAFLDSLTHSKGARNYFGYNNRDMDSLIERARAAGGLQTKAQLYREAQQRVLDDAILVPIWWRSAR